jgi:hypothetical protein
VTAKGALNLKRREAAVTADQELRRKLRKIETLFAGAATDGWRRNGSRRSCAGFQHNEIKGVGGVDGRPTNRS